ncbi:RagB/SusD family nutrient uptake outer membrane protein [Pedobacter psychroterrae]|uniref:RagB/SusD family nutrient uptake outer membrane protein n=1 Tax=Pedobacter psychroterrae TaxID=2530453 RepID=A0A4R0NVU3_9SPHI|nr:RagB/SusD family nutrient uptake outer membrane protein [Pedobacter psychroterrae]TCD03164.1 RagB/SusD family nutrient uptake outer membrane protein [Pedobacter psychroterrae]
MKKISILFYLLVLISCTKKLELKPESSLVVPSSIKDLESLLENNNAVMNLTPSLAQLSADEYFIPSQTDFLSLRNVTGRTTYLWEKDIFQGQTQITDWLTPYKAIFYANSVLGVLEQQPGSNDPAKAIVKGWALFVRAYSHYALVSTFSKAFDTQTSTTDLGIPIKLNAGIDQIEPRASVQQTYEQIIRDATQSAELLQQDIIPGKRNRPSKVAAYAFLARVYLSMRQYPQAEENADKALALYSVLTDFNNLSLTAFGAFDYNSVETIYFSEMNLSLYTQTAAFNSVVYGVDPELIGLYSSNDLRLPIYFRQNAAGNYNPKAINNISQIPFTGLATDEMYLIKAECLARRSEKDQALTLLNTLIQSRTQTGTFLPRTAESPQETLELILTERRKALVWRSLRWTDLKRLNLEGRNIVLTRVLNGQNYTLEPNSPKYVMPIPDDEIVLSGITQNMR